MIKLRIDGQEDRRAIAAILADNGFKVTIEETTRESENMLSETVYYMVIDVPVTKNKKVYADFSEIINNLEDDIELDLAKGESGAKTYKSALEAVKKYTLKKLNEKCKKYKV